MQSCAFMKKRLRLLHVAFYVLKSMKNQKKNFFCKFWKLSTWEAKKSYLHGLVERRQPKKRRATTDKNCPIKPFGYNCFLPKTDGAKVPVCRKFMLNTLDITKDSINRWLKIYKIQLSMTTIR
ncbi:hypothetical protein ILUMI_18327, partial [Ignelater luminosus]